MICGVKKGKKIATLKIKTKHEKTKASEISKS